MEIRSLDHTPLNQIVECLVESFAGYFVPMPSDQNYWEKRIESARVDYSMSYGMFEGDSMQLLQAASTTTLTKTKWNCPFKYHQKE